jgi:hypothetical protein
VSSYAARITSRISSWEDAILAPSLALSHTRDNRPLTLTLCAVAAGELGVRVAPVLQPPTWPPLDYDGAADSLSLTLWLPHIGVQLFNKEIVRSRHQTEQPFRVLHPPARAEITLIPSAENDENMFS